MATFKSRPRSIRIPEVSKMSFEDELKQIQRRAGVNEADVDDTFLGRRQQQMQRDTERDVEGLQTELQTKLKIREHTSARLASTISEELTLRMKRIVALHPEQAKGKTAEQLLSELAFSREFEDYVDPILNNIKEQVRMDIKKR